MEWTDLAKGGSVGEQRDRRMSGPMDVSIYVPMYRWMDGYWSKLVWINGQIGEWEDDVLIDR